ncbi:MAG: hypothetical protein OXC46_08005 [Thaumarchaeota archaeon]|nr:hypothetical protein [Nitrososphaerota archaeon]
MERYHKPVRKEVVIKESLNGSSKFSNKILLGQSVYDEPKKKIIIIKGGAYKPRAAHGKPDKDGYYWITDKKTHRKFKVKPGEDIDDARSRGGVGFSLDGKDCDCDECGKDCKDCDDDCCDECKDK